MRKQITLVIFLEVIGLGMSVGCKDPSGLQGPSRVSPAMTQVKVTCSQDQLTTTKTKEVTGANGRTVRIEGQICLSGETTTVTGSAHILFIVDRSNSMTYADPSSTATSCGRYKAIKKVISATIGSDSTRDIKGALVTFANTAEVISSWTSLADLSYLGVCGIYGGNNLGTNYEDAFLKAKSLLQGKSGTNIVYFITDGAPEQSNKSSRDKNHWKEGQSAGRIAMNSLKSAVPDLTFNAVYLKDPGLEAGVYSDSGMPTMNEAKQYLIDIVGNSSQVKVAQNADDLVSQIGTFETIPSGTFSSKSDLNAYVVVDGAKSSVKVEKLEYQSEGVYNYKLASTALQGTVGEVVENTFVVKGKGSNGETSTSKVIVKFTRTN